MFRTMAIIGLCGAASVAHADQRNGGFKGPDNFQQVTVAEAAALPDDAAVRLEGFVVKALGDEKYEFRDDSGTLVVEIDDDEWNGFEATPETRLRLHGEIEQEGQRTELDVDGIQAAD